MLEEDGRLRNLRAENYILNQRVSAEWIYASEEWKKEARQFCVKGLAEIDMLKEIQAKLEEAQREGLGLRQFKKQIVPYLQEKGWLGGDEKEIGHRVRIIFDTNLASARASAKWQKIQETKDKMPYLQYLPSLSADKRDEHKAFYGLIAKADDEIWQRIFPPNGYNCKCRTRQLTEKQAQKLIKEQEENGGRITVDNNAINKAVDSSFQHCHENLEGFFNVFKKKHGEVPFNKMLKDLLKEKAKAESGTVDNRIHKGLLLIEKHQNIFESEDYAKDARKQLLKIFEAENVSYLGEISYCYQEGNKELAQDFFTALKFIPSNCVEESNNYGRIIIVNNEQVNRKTSSHALLTKTDIDNYNAKQQAFFDLKGKKIPSDKVADNGDSLICLEKVPSDIYRSSIHEFAHRIQVMHPEIQKDYQTIWNRRDGVFELLRDVVKRRTIPANIVVKKDDFYTPYFGRIYADPITKELKALEVMSASFENFFHPKTSSNFMREDLELFALTLQTVISLGRKK